MNLYLISQNTNNGYDVYGSAVVAAPEMAIARRMHPRDGSVQGAPDRRAHEFNAWNERWNHYSASVENGVLRLQRGTWAWPDDVQVKLLGVAASSVEQGVICASFRAG